MVDSARGFGRGHRVASNGEKNFRPPHPVFEIFGVKFWYLTSFPDKPEVERVTPAKRRWGVPRATIPENFAEFRRRVPELFEKNFWHFLPEVAIGNNGRISYAGAQRAKRLEMESDIVMKTPLHLAWSESWSREPSVADWYSQPNMASQSKIARYWTASESSESALDAIFGLKMLLQAIWSICRKVDQSTIGGGGKNSPSWIYAENVSRTILANLQKSGPKFSKGGYFQL